MNCVIWSFVLQKKEIWEIHFWFIWMEIQAQKLFFVEIIGEQKIQHKTANLWTWWWKSCNSMKMSTENFFLIKNLLIFFMPQRDVQCIFFSQHNEAMLHSSLSVNIKKIHGHHFRLNMYDTKEMEMKEWKNTTNKKFNKIKIYWRISFKRITQNHIWF